MKFQRYYFFPSPLLRVVYLKKCDALLYFFERTRHLRWKSLRGGSFIFIFKRYNFLMKILMKILFMRRLYMIYFL